MNLTARRSNRSKPRIQLPKSYVEQRRDTLGGITLFFSPSHVAETQAGIPIAIVGFFDPTETNELETLELETRARGGYVAVGRKDREGTTKNQVPSRRNVTQGRDRFLPGRCSHVSNMQMRVHNLSFARRPHVEKV